MKGEAIARVRRQQEVARKNRVEAARREHEDWMLEQKIAAQISCGEHLRSQSPLTYGPEAAPFSPSWWESPLGGHP